MVGENLGVAPPTFGFRFVARGLEFGEAPQVVSKAKKETCKDFAQEWLQKRMKADKWYPAAKLADEAKTLGSPPGGSLQRAREALGIVKPMNVKNEGGVSMWRRPPQLITDRPDDKG